MTGRKVGAWGGGDIISYNGYVSPPLATQGRGCPHSIVRGGDIHQLHKKTSSQSWKMITHKPSLHK